MLVRRIARPLLATAFVVDGVDAVRNPQAHVERADTAWQRLGERVDLPPMSRERLTMLVRLHGAVTVASAVALAVGRAPRTAALLLAGLTVPVAVTDALVVSGDVRGTSVERSRLWNRLSLLGAAVIAGVDLEGRPGLAWRAGHARVDREAAKEARSAVAEARREMKAALKEARRVSD